MVTLNSKHVFWQAFVIALVIFLAGIILGVMFENARANKLQRFYLNTETDIFDINLKGSILVDGNFSCELLLKENIDFANKVYLEAKQLEKYDSSTKISNEIKFLHRRYDLLRTMLWYNLIQQNKNCISKMNIVVYLYQYDLPNVETKAKQTTISKVLLNLKEKQGDKVILIPIAYDTGVGALDLLEKEFNITEFPVVIINNKHQIHDLVNEIDLEKSLN